MYAPPSLDPPGTKEQSPRVSDSRTHDRGCQVRAGRNKRRLGYMRSVIEQRADLQAPIAHVVERITALLEGGQTRG